MNRNGERPFSFEQNAYLPRAADPRSRHRDRREKWLGGSLQYTSRGGIGNSVLKIETVVGDMMDRITHDFC